MAGPLAPGLPRRGDYRVLRLPLEAGPGDALRLLGSPWGSGWRAYFAAPGGGRAVLGLGRLAFATGPGAWQDLGYLRRVQAACAGEPEGLPWFVGAAFGAGQASAGLEAAAVARLRRRPGPWTGAGGPAPAAGSRPDGTWLGFPPSGLWLPRLCLVVAPAGAQLHVAGYQATDRELEAVAARVRAWLRSPAPAPRGDLPPPGRAAPPQVLSALEREALRRRVEVALAAIAGGEVRKVVVATRHRAALRWPLDAATALARLVAAQPGCFHYLVQPRPHRALVGASPERLVAVDGPRLRTMALAGSAPRAADPAVDEALGAALLASAKDRAEHALVVAAIEAELSPHAAALSVPAEPGLLKLAGIQHLCTPIEARLPGQASALGLAARLHPTPALAGTPREAALALIRRIEGEGRGWYGGALGWVDAAGDGELAVAIRCLLLAGERVTAFAGAGIVAGSDPDREVAEIELKLGAALAAVADRLGAAP